MNCNRGCGTNIPTPGPFAGGHEYMCKACRSRVRREQRAARNAPREDPPAIDVSDLEGVVPERYTETPQQASRLPHSRRHTPRWTTGHPAGGNIADDAPFPVPDWQTAATAPLPTTPTTCPPDEVDSGLAFLVEACDRVSACCPAVEFRVVKFVCERLALGRTRYGVMPEKSDRNLRREGSEEGIDWIIYAAQLWLEES